MNGEKVLDISWGTIFKVGIAFFGFYILYLIKDILIWFVFALIISILFNPAIDFFQKRKIPRVISTIFVYVGIFGIISFLVYATVPLFISEIQYFSQILPQYFEKTSPFLRKLGIQAFENIESFLNFLSKTLESITANIFNTIFVIFGGIFSTIFVLTIAIFLSLEEKPIEKVISLFFPKKYEAYLLSLWSRCQKRVSGWFLSRILGCLFVGLLCYLTFLLFNTKYPFSLALLAGTLNFIPIVGPLITGILIFLIISLENISKALFVLIVFILIQQIESNIFLPVLTKKFLGLSPALVLMALAIGGTLFGFLGAILAIPLTGILFEFLRDFLKKKKAEKEKIVVL